MSRKAWIVLVPGYKPIHMCGEPMTYEEAIRFARIIWPDADIQH